MRCEHSPSDGYVLILAPTARDAEATAAILQQQSIASLICGNIGQLCAHMQEADAAILTEEAILADSSHRLEQLLKDQPAWSDFPLIVLTLAAGREFHKTQQMAKTTGNMTLIARPVQISTLISTVQTALRDRKRQYRLRDYLSEHEAQAEAIREAREHLELMVESARDFAIFSLDKQGVITSWNSGAAKIFGYAQEEIIGKSGALVFTEEDQEAGVPQYEMAKAAKEGRASDERWHLRKGGARFYASGIMAAMLDKAGGVRGFLKIARDNTEQKAAEEAIVAARNDAEAASKAKTEFLTNMSHEIRTPMNAVIGLSNILAKSQPLTFKQKEYIDTLRTSADSLLALINDLLDIAKIEAQTIELEQVPFSLTQLIEEVVCMTSLRAKEKNLRFSGAGECVHGRMFIGDPTRIRQIVLNLCSNALKFTERGSVHIAITSEPTEDEGVELISIAVEDTGIGIAPDKLPLIFEKFVQGDSSINRKYGGTGLGLAITQTLAQVMGGSIKAESIPGEGSVFTVTLPLKLARDEDLKQENHSLPELTQLKQSQPAFTILLVEDYEANVLVARTFLEEFGYACEVASNGIEAIEKIKNHSYHAVLMDVQMHGMDGLEATQLIREYERQKNRPRLPVIGMTAHALAGDRERCISSGMDNYISKPFNPAELKLMLEEYCHSNCAA